MHTMVNISKYITMFHFQNYKDVHDIIFFRLSIADLTLQLVTPTTQKKIGEEARVLLGGQNLSNQAKTYT